MGFSFFFFFIFSWGRRGRSVLKAVSFWWQEWLSVYLFLESMLWFFFFFRARCIWLMTVPFYHINLISYFCGSLYFFISSLATLKPKWLFLVSCIGKTENIWYDVLLILSIKVCLVLRYSEQSSESVEICVSYFNLSTWWLLFQSVNWNFCMLFMGLHILPLVIKTGHILFLFSVCNSFRLLILDIFLEIRCLKRPLLNNLFSDFITVDIRQQL